MWSLAFEEKYPTKIWPLDPTHFGLIEGNDQLSHLDAPCSLPLRRYW